MIVTLKTKMKASVDFWILACILLWELGPSGGHEIVDFVVPTLADPRDNATLSCRYMMGNDLLYSAKWFKDDHEVFRYMPGLQPAGLPFPVPGIQLIREPQCSHVSCDLQLTELVQESAGSYRCEVSTEAPTFRIVQRSGNMTVAALARRDPRIDGLAIRYSLGEEIRVNCTSDPALPPWELSWFVNDVEASFLNIEGPWTGPGDRMGLSRSVLGLRLMAERPMFRDGELRLRCVASAPPGIKGGPYRRQTIGVTSLQPPAFLEQLSWPGSGTIRVQSSHTVYLHILLFFFSTIYRRIFSKC